MVHFTYSYTHRRRFHFQEYACLPQWRLNSTTAMANVYVVATAAKYNWKAYERCGRNLPSYNISTHLVTWRFSIKNRAMWHNTRTSSSFFSLACSPTERWKKIGLCRHFLYHVLLYFGLCLDISHKSIHIPSFNAFSCLFANKVCKILLSQIRSLHPCMEHYHCYCMN